jgi:ferredoxin-NADP reductase
VPVLSSLCVGITILLAALSEANQRGRQVDVPYAVRDKENLALLHGTHSTALQYT